MNERITKRTTDCLYHMIWYDMIWYDMISHDMLWYHMIWYHITWYAMIWYHMIWYDITWYAIISYDIIAYHVIWYHIIWYHIISYHSIAYHIISYHIIWYHMIFMFVPRHSHLPLRVHASLSPSHLTSSYVRLATECMALLQNLTSMMLASSSISHTTENAKWSEGRYEWQVMREMMNR